MRARHGRRRGIGVDGDEGTCAFTGRIGDPVQGCVDQIPDSQRAGVELAGKFIESCHIPPVCQTG